MAMLLNMEKSGDSTFLRVPEGAFGDAAKGKKIEAVVYGELVLLYPWKVNPRSGWANALAALHKRGEDHPLLG